MAKEVKWATQFDDVEKKIIRGAIEYAKDAYPDPGAHLKKVIAKLCKICDEQEYELRGRDA